MKSGSGKIVYDGKDGEVHWSQFMPLTRKTKVANYPSAHPPWVTYGLLSVVGFGLGCSDEYNHNENNTKSSSDTFSSSSLETSVASMEKNDSCFICETPLM